MPTLEDTTEFEVATLNDLLEADAKGGIAAGGGDEGRYRRWAFLSTGAAAILAVLLVVALVTGGGDDGGGGGGGQAIKAPAGTQAVIVEVADITSDITVDSLVSVLDEEGQAVSRNATVLKITDVKGFAGRTLKKLELGIPTGDVRAVRAADAAGTLSVVGGEVDTEPTTEAPPAETPAATEPVPVPIEPETAPPG